jgi:hypothetical protein
VAEDSASTGVISTGAAVIGGTSLGDAVGWEVGGKCCALVATAGLDSVLGAGMQATRIMEITQTRKKVCDFIL